MTSNLILKCKTDYKIDFLAVSESVGSEDKLFWGHWSLKHYLFINSSCWWRRGSSLLFSYVFIFIYFFLWISCETTLNIHFTSSQFYIISCIRQYFLFQNCKCKLWSKGILLFLYYSFVYIFCLQVWENMYKTLLHWEWDNWPWPTGHGPASHGRLAAAQLVTGDDWPQPNWP